VAKNKDDAWRRAKLSHLSELDFLEKDLSNKLENLVYEDLHKKCEEEEESHPETFKAKWK